MEAAKHTVTAGVIVDQNQRTNLIVQALEIAEVTTGSDGKAYADSVMDILLQVDGEDRGRTPSSPTPSNRSNLTAGTSRSARGRSGIVDEAVEMVLTRARNGRWSFNSSLCSDKHVRFFLLPDLFRNFDRPLHNSAKGGRIHHTPRHMCSHGM